MHEVERQLGLNEDVLREMDVVAVESTRSYRRWSALPDGATFIASCIEWREGA